MSEQQQPLNGINVFIEGDRVCIGIGNGQTNLTALLDPLAARRVGIAILNRAAEVARGAVDDEPKPKKERVEQ